MDEPLAGTAPLRTEWRATFRDRYAQQHEQTRTWMEGALAELARQRDRQRRRDTGWLDEQRVTLAQLTGANQVPADVTGISAFLLANGESAYVLRTASGVCFGGRVWEPERGAPRAVVLLARPDGEDVAPLVAAYRRQGCRVVAPALPCGTFSFAADPQRRSYRFADEELLHLFFFIVGGSVAGMDAVEVQATARSFGAVDGEALPVVLDFSGRHTLTATITAALAPSLVSLLVLHEDVAALDHQERDKRVNTIWAFHRHFDALVLLALAEQTDLLFVETTPTPSSVFSRTLTYDRDTARNVNSVVLEDDDAGKLAAAVAEHLAPAPARDRLRVDSVAPPDDLRTVDELYRRTVRSKLAWLEQEHERARQRRRARYIPGELSVEAYRDRVAESLTRVMGPPLPETSDHCVRTRQIARHAGHTVYEVVLEAVPGLDMAGYLLVPTSGLPAPAVICQHGAGGRADAAAGVAESFAYDWYGARLADKGYVVFAPYANWGWGARAGRDSLVKPAYALGITPNRFEAAQLHAVVDFLQSRPEVIADRIGYYGLSYGGHSSLWLGSGEPRLALRITSGFFNEFQKKLTATGGPAPWSADNPRSFICVDEGYDMFTYNALNELGHAEMATSQVPQPYYVENGLRDGVAPNAWVDEEFAHVAAVYCAYGAPEAAVLEHFDGPHRVWTEGSFMFLHRHLKGVGTSTAVPERKPGD